MRHKNRDRLKTVMTICVTIFIVIAMSQIVVARDSTLGKEDIRENRIYSNQIGQNQIDPGVKSIANYQSLPRHAMVWNKDNGMKDLTPGGTESDAYGINRKGNIVGFITVNSKRRASFWEKDDDKYELTNIGKLITGSVSSEANIINDKGQVTIDSEDATGNINAYLWSKKTGIVDIGTLGGIYSHAHDINNRGQIAGDSTTVTDITNAFIWQKGVMTNIGTLGGGPTDSSWAYDINNKGQIVGESTSSTGNSHAYVWDKKHKMTDLGTLPGDDISTAHAINEKGQVVGSSFKVGGNVHAFYWSKKTGMIDIGSIGGGQSEAYDINNKGEVAGVSYTLGGEVHAFYWSKKTGMIDLGTLGGDWSETSHINNRGQVMGDSNIAPNGFDRTFVWDKKHGKINLGILPGKEITWSHNINDKGTVIGHIK